MNKNPFEFWSFRDVRKEKFPVPKIVNIPQDSLNIQKNVKILLSHHYLIPREQTPKVILDYFKASLTIENPEFENWKKHGKGFVPKYVKPHLCMYVADSKYLGLPRSIKFEEIVEAYKKQNIEVELQDIRPDFEKIELKRNHKYEPLFYQKEAIDKIVNTSIILKLMCGKGKTALTLLALDQIRYRTLIIVTTNLLIKQWVEEIHNVFDISEKDIGIINGEQKTEGQITVATVQSLIALSRNRKQQMSMTYGHIVCDEVHEAAAPQYYRLLQYFKCRKITGLSATPIRQDGTSRIISCYIGRIEEIDDIGIVPIKFDLVKTEFDFVYDARQLNAYTKLLQELIVDEKRNKLIIDKLIEYLNKGKFIFVYSHRVKHLETLRQKLFELRPDIVTELLVEKSSDGKKISVDTQEVIRQKANKEEVSVIFGTHIIKRGFNVKPLSAAVVATPTKSTILIEQLIGRLQREYKGKDEVFYVDFIDEKVKTLLFQFFFKNKKIYKKYRERSCDSIETSRMPKQLEFAL